MTEARDVEEIVDTLTLMIDWSDLDRCGDEVRALIAEWRAQKAEIERLEKENFALSANQCHDGYGDDWGHHRCRDIDRAAEVMRAKCEAIARDYGERRKGHYFDLGTAHRIRDDIAALKQS